MNKKYPWLPIDERLIPDIFSWEYPKSFWVRALLVVEMTFAVLAVLGTLLLVILPRPANEFKTQEINATSSTPPK